VRFHSSYPPLCFCLRLYLLLSLMTLFGGIAKPLDFGFLTSILNDLIFITPRILSKIFNGVNLFFDLFFLFYDEINQPPLSLNLREMRFVRKCIYRKGKESVLCLLSVENVVDEFFKHNFLFVSGYGELTPYPFCF